jgi:hypothetical protein
MEIKEILKLVEREKINFIDLKVLIFGEDGGM